MGEIAIHAEGLGKRYRIGVRQKYKALRDTLTDAMYAPIRAISSLLVRNGHSSSSEEATRDAHIWALRDVSFDIKKGEVVGIIGSNGAGKSTLLKVLSRITEPTEGLVKVYGRVGTLLEVGTGFHPELSGRENIFLNGAILGMKRSEIVSKFDEIVAFAEVERFIDTPVKHYSSGMFVRLAFSVAAHLEPEILMVDEVLAVGDVVFQKKCMGKMGDVAKQGRTVLFVSHNMGAVNQLCSRAIMIRAGGVVMDGAPAEVVSGYLKSAVYEGSASAGQIFWLNDQDMPPGSEDIYLRGIKLLGPSGEPQSQFEPSDPIRVQIFYEVRKPLRGLRLSLHVSTKEGEQAFIGTDHDRRKEEEAPGLYMTTCVLPGNLLNLREYIIGVRGDVPAVKVVLPLTECLSVSIFGPPNHGSNFPGEVIPGVVCPRLEWEIKPLPSMDLVSHL